MASTDIQATPRGMQPPNKGPVRITKPEDTKVRYGDAFWPKTPFQSIFYIAAMFGALLILALASPAPLQNPADPLNHEAIDPKPEWYFMFLFQLLKYFPGSFEVVGTVIIPGLLTTLLIALPFYDRNWARKLSRRPVAAASMTGAMLVIMFLTWGGLGYPTPDFNSSSQTVTPAPASSGGGGAVAQTISPQVSAIFAAHCASCHLNGNVLGGLNLSNYAGLIKGGNVVAGSVLAPGDHTKSVLWQIMQPKGPWPAGNRMPLGGPYLATADISTIATWIDSLGGKSGGAAAGGATGGSAMAGGATAGAKQVSFKSDIQSLFTAHCLACHAAGVASGGLNLSNYQGMVKGGNIVPGSVFKAGDHAQSYLWQIVQPKAPWPGGARMPLGGPYLDGTSIQTVASWIDQGAKDN